MIASITLRGILEEEKLPPVYSKKLDSELMTSHSR
jgi:hypothetical protein